MSASKASSWDERESAGAVVDTLSTLVPRLLLRRLARDPRRAIVAGSETIDGALLHVDLARFSILAARLAEAGPTGPERLGRVLEASFERIVDAVHASGGDVLNFSGDGLLALWGADPQSRSGMGEAVHAVALCAARLRRELHAFEPLRGIEVKARMCIAAGEVQVATLGGVYGRWELLPAGEPIAELRGAAGLARRGDVLVTEEAWKSLRAHYTAERLSPTLLRLGHAAIGTRPPRGRPAPPVPVTAAMEAGLRSFVSGAAQSRLDRGRGIRNELRTVSVLFVQLPLSAHQTSLERAQSVMTLIQEVIYRHEGGLNKISVDDKGASIVAAMGLPPKPHPDDARRALRAALELESALSETGLRARIGVATGRAYCGAVGATSRREYTMIGETVNRAARLMEMAVHGHAVLCDRPTREAGRGYFEFGPAQGSQLNGTQTALEAHGVLGAGAPRAQVASAMVGRQAEREALSGLLAGLVEGQGGHALIRGAAGIGKSRLLADLRERAQERGVRVLEGQASSVQRRSAYLMWRGVFGELLDAAATEAEMWRRRAMEWVQGDDWAQRHLDLVGAVVPRWPVQGAVDLAEGEARQRATQRLLLTLLERAAARGPLLIVLEDAHWADVASWSLLRRVARSDIPLMLVSAMRPDPALPSAKIAEMLASSTMTLIDLAPLSAEQTEALVRARLRGSSAPDRVAALIGAKVQGHPLYGEQLALSVREAIAADCPERARERDGPHAGRTPSAEVLREALARPNSVEGVVIARIDRLAPDEQRVLRVASVIGPRFDRPLLLALLRDELGGPAIHRVLERLVGLDLLRYVPEPAGTMAFEHEVLRDVTYNLLLYSDRRSLHGRIARWLDRQAQVSAGHAVDHALLAHHWLAAEEPRRALAHLEPAAAASVADFAHEDARVLLRSAFDLLSDESVMLHDEGRARLHRLRATVHLAAGEMQEAKAELAEALATVGQPTPCGSAGRIIGVLGRVRSLIARRLLRRGPRADTLGAFEAASAYELLAEVHFHVNDSLGTLHALLGTLDLAEQMPPAPILARAYANACIGANTVPLHGLSRHFARRSRETADAVGGASTRGFVLSRTAVYGYGVGDWHLAIPAFREARSIARRLGDPRLEGECQAALWQCDYFRGQLESLMEDCRGSTLEQRTGDIQHRYWRLLWLSHAQMRLNRAEEALATLDEIDELLDRDPGLGDRFIAQGVGALALLRLGRDAEALAMAQRLQRTASRTKPISRSTLEGYAAGVQVYHSLATRDSSAERRRELGDLAAEAIGGLAGYARRFLIGKPRACLWRGALLWSSGREQGALRTWRDGLGVARQLELRLEQAQLHRVLEAHGPMGGAHRSGHALRAAELEQALGARVEAPRLGRP